MTIRWFFIVALVALVAVGLVIAVIHDINEFTSQREEIVQTRRDNLGKNAEGYYRCMAGIGSLDPSVRPLPREADRACRMRMREPQE